MTPSLPHIISRGTKPLPVVRTENEVIPFETIYEDDPSAYVGTEVIKQDGKEGLKKVTYTDEVVTDTQVVTQPINQIILRGTKPLPVIRTEEVTIPFETLYQESPGLLFGERYIYQRGINGLVEKTYTDGQLTQEVTIKEAVPEIIRFGTRQLDKAPLLALLEEASKVQEGDFSQSSWRTLKFAIIDGQNILSSSIRQQEPIDRAYQTLKNALNQLTVDKTELHQVLNEASALVEEDYSRQSWQMLAAVKEQAEAVDNSSQSKQSEVDAASQTLKEAIEALTVDKTELQGLLEIVQHLNSQDYSSASWAILEAAKAQANDVNDNTQAKQGAIDSAYQQLNTALNTLTVDKEALKALVELANQKVETDFEKTSWQTFIRLKETAEAVLVAQNSTQAQVYKAYEDLQAGLNQLQVDTSDLQHLIAIAQQNVQQDYTADSWSNLQNAQEAARQLLVSNDLKQSQIDAAATRLQEALDALVTRQETKPTLVLDTLQKDDLDKTVTLSYKLVDPDSLYQSATVTVYDGENQIVSYPISDLANTEITLPEYDVSYRLETSFTYLKDSQPTTETIAAKEVTLEIKAIEIKDIDSLSLYRYADNHFSRVATLASLPSDISSYFVRIKSDRFRDMLLPISNIEEVNLETGEKAYKVTTDIEELVQDMDPSGQSLYQNQFSFMVLETPKEADVYTSFAELLTAMTANPSGRFILGADLFADEVTKSADQLAYLNTTFTGSLTGQYQNQQFAIYNLTAPLFNRLQNATVENLDLKDVTIVTSREQLGALASWAVSSRITDVSASGSITAPRHIGGLVYMSDKSILTNTSFTGNITATATNYVSNVGGIAGALSRGTIKDSYVKATITVNNSDRYARTGGIVGFTNGTSSQETFNVINVYADGDLVNQASGGFAGGIVGSTEGYDQGRLKNIISKMNLTNAKAVYGYESVSADRMVDLKRVTTNTSGDTQNDVSLISPEEAEKAIAALGITTSTKDSSLFTESQYLETDYLSLAKAKADHARAYRNMERLIPFYNKEVLVKYGNRVGLDDKLNQVDLLSVTPMIDNTIISDVASNKQALNRLMLNYADGSVAYLSLRYRDDFKNAAISEYDIVGTDLIYTPEQFLSTYDAIVNAVLPDLQGLVYKSDDTLNTLREPFSDATNRDKILDALYLEESFDQVKSQMASYLRSILATDKSINTSDGVIANYLVDYIKQNKTKIVLGLAYLMRWYNVQFDQVNLKEIASFHQDFYGKPINTMEWLVSLADSGYYGLIAYNNLKTYQDYIAQNTGYNDLPSYLSANRKALTDYADDNTWFKAASKAYIVEKPSNEVPDRKVGIFDILSEPGSKETNGILPLLTAQEGLFVITNMTSISYGMYDRYLSMADKDTNPETYKANVDNLKQMVDQAAEWQKNHFDLWYRLVPDNVKANLLRRIPVWDGYRVDNKWLDKVGTNSNQAIRDFFGPVGYRSDVAFNGSGAYANGSKVAYVYDKLLGHYGHSVFTHEMTHNNDGSAYLGGYGRRFGLGAESFALGLLQAEGKGKAGESTHFTLNTMFDHSAQKDATNRYVNVSPDRFTTAKDVQDYLHNLLDVIYILDYAEAQAMLKQTDDNKKVWYGRFENKVTASGAASDVINYLSDDTAAALKSWEDLVDNNITSTKSFSLEKDYHGNGYYTIPMFTSNYSAMSNDQGAPGGLTFRRMAFELWAAKGYEGGFLPYASNQLYSANQTLNDDIVFNHVFGSEYTDWKAFKKAMFQERIDQLDRLSSTSFSYFGDKQITSYETLQALMEEAVNNDLNHGLARISGRGSYVQLLKMAIFNAYLRQTDDFRTSIFSENITL